MLRKLTYSQMFIIKTIIDDTILIEGFSFVLPSH